VLAVKDNQALLHEAIRDYFETAMTSQFDGVAHASFEETDFGYGRYEVRRYWLVEDLSTLPEPQNWSGLQSIAMLESERHHGEHVSRERRY
jgi:hypothetical protein